MDLVAGVKRIFVMTEHTTKTGEPKILKNCTYPLTGKAVVDRIYTNLAIIDVAEGGLFVTRLAPGVEFNTVQKKTEALLVDATNASSDRTGPVRKEKATAA